MNMYDADPVNLCKPGATRHRDLVKYCYGLPITSTIALKCNGVICDECRVIISECNVCPRCKEDTGVVFDKYTKCDKCGSVMRVFGRPPRLIVTAIATMADWMTTSEDDVI